MTLTSFLLARIAEDEAAARRTLSESDLLDWSGRWSDADGLHGPADGPSGCTSLVIDPARVLAECEAKRRIVDLHTPGSWTSVVVNGEDFDASECPTCSVTLDDPRAPLVPGAAMAEEVVDVPYPCETLRLVALPYADHPDYDEAWRT